MLRPAHINERMGNTGGCLWESRQFSSTQNEPYETCPIVNRSLMVSVSRADKKSVEIIIVIKTQMCHQIYLCGVQVKSMCAFSWICVFTVRNLYSSCTLFLLFSQVFFSCFVPSSVFTENFYHTLVYCTLDIKSRLISLTSVQCSSIALS